MISANDSLIDYVFADAAVRRAPDLSLVPVELPQLGAFHEGESRNRICSDGPVARSLPVQSAVTLASSGVRVRIGRTTVSVTARSETRVWWSDVRSRTRSLTARYRQPGPDEGAYVTRGARNRRVSAAWKRSSPRAQCSCVVWADSLRGGSIRALGWCVGAADVRRELRDWHGSSGKMYFWHPVDASCDTRRTAIRRAS